MPFHQVDTMVFVEGCCSVEEAEPLHAMLCELDDPVVDFRLAAHLHTSIVQVVMASGARVRHLPRDAVLEACLGDRRLHEGAAP